MNINMTDLFLVASTVSAVRQRNSVATAVRRTRMVEAAVTLRMCSAPLSRIVVF